MKNANDTAAQELTLASLMQAMKATASPTPLAVDVPPWGRIYVRPQTVEEVDAYSEDDKADETKTRRLARGAARVICDAQGKRLFDPNNEEHLTILAQQPWSLLQKVLGRLSEGEQPGK